MQDWTAEQYNQRSIEWAERLNLAGEAYIAKRITEAEYMSLKNQLMQESKIEEGNLALDLERASADCR